MADGEDQENKTEAASARRLNQLYEEGQVTVGHDLVQVAALAFALVALTFAAGPAVRQLVHAVREIARSAGQTPFGSLPVLLAPAGLLLLYTCAAAAAAAVIATFVQTRGGVWPDLALPDFSRLYQPTRLTRMFTSEFLVDLAMAAVKVLAIGGVAYLTLRDDFVTLPKLLTTAAVDQLPALTGPLQRTAVRVVAAMAVLAGVDFAVARLRFLKKNKMTREEAKREYREDEGDPQIRSRRKRRHRELSKGRASVEVPKADALVVNPTHVAVAIRYRKDESAAPRVISKGKGKLAEVMRELAREHGVPIVEDIALARLLYKRVKVGGEVPADTFKAVAAILAFVYRVSGRVPGQGAGAAS